MALRAVPEPLEPTPRPTAPAGAAASSTGTAAATMGSSSSSSSQGLQPKLQQRRVAVPGSQQLPGWSAGVGAFGAIIGVFAVYWAVAGRPEFGDLAARADYLQATFNSNRVSAGRPASGMCGGCDLKHRSRTGAVTQPTRGSWAEIGE